MLRLTPSPPPVRGPATGTLRTVTAADHHPLARARRGRGSAPLEAARTARVASDRVNDQIDVSFWVQNGLVKVLDTDGPDGTPCGLTVHVSAGHWRSSPPK